MLSSSDILVWVQNGRGNTDLNIPTTTHKLFKGPDGLITLLAPNHTGVYAPVNLDTLPNSAPNNSFIHYRPPVFALYRDSQGNHQLFSGPLTVEQAKRWYPAYYQESQPKKPKPKKQKPKQLSPNAVPAQADKTRIAKDILRTLGSQVVGEKRSREAFTPDSELRRDGGPKRQTTSRELNVTNPTVTIVDPLTAPVVHPTVPQPALPAPEPPKEPEPVRPAIQKPVQIVSERPPPVAVVVPASPKSSSVPTLHSLPKSGPKLGLFTSVLQSPPTSRKPLTFTPKPSTVAPKPSIAAPKPSPAPIQQSSLLKHATTKPSANEENGNGQDILMISPSPSPPPPIPTNNIAGPSNSPLFLPSPSSSPSGISIPDFGDEPIRTGTDNGKRPKQYGKRPNQVVETGMQSTSRRTVFPRGKDRLIVLMPSPPEWVRKDLERRRRGKARDTRGVVVVSNVRTRTDRVRAAGSEGTR